MAAEKKVVPEAIDAVLRRPSIVDTSVFIDAIRTGAVIGVPEGALGYHSYSFVTAKELLCVRGRGRIIQSAAVLTGVGTADINDRELLSLLRRQFGRGVFSKEASTGMHAISRRWLQAFRREFRVLSGLNCLPVTSRIKEIAGDLLSVHKRRITDRNDATIAATAIFHRLPLWTLDARLAELAGSYKLPADDNARNHRTTVRSRQRPAQRGRCG